MNKKKMKPVLLWMLVVVIITGAGFVYRQLTRPDTLRFNQVLIPTEDGRWLRTLFLIEEPTLNLDNYKVTNENEALPDFYQDSISGIKPEVQTYLRQRNAIIREFEKRFSPTSNEDKNDKETVFLKPFDSLEVINEILPLAKNGENLILVIGEEEWFSSKYFLLDSSFQLLHELNETEYSGSSVVSAKFLDRAWIHIKGFGGNICVIGINQVNVDNNLLIVDRIYWETEYLVEEVFNTFKVTKVSSNPMLAVYDSGKSDFWFMVIWFLRMGWVFNPLRFLSLPCFLVLIVLLFLLIRYRKQINMKFQSICRKFLDFQKKD